MDPKEFISLVQEKTCLWDQSDENYHLRERQRAAWKNISDTIDIPVDELKKKWRGYRDTFARELRKAKSIQSEDEVSISKWPYFVDLLFLKDMINKGVRDTPVMKNMDQKLRKKRKIKKQYVNDFDQEFLHVEEEKLLYNNSFQENVVDSDAQFLMSLLPFLKDLPKSRKLIVRTKLQQVLINELSGTVQDYDSNDSS